ncbi:YcnI family protein [Streptomyces sp. MUM 203J]|uniref:YcnI family copper-binding membrane protein n=1 Tax=Streptomyces sp. MUM 203J TaxID=2791990 RepID=UPI001F034D78|nr:YcnI family protein [Streptomyces sp. MUM 203J]MCH0538845.1 YcnI family protein [Streptomyces sp. MUM 203J]
MSRTTSAASARSVPSALGRMAVAGGLAVSSVLLLSPSAYAHVSVQPQGAAAKGGYATVNFKVPNERDNASTVKLEVTLPTDHPLASVMPQAVPGWKVEVERAELKKPLELHGKKITEAPSKITWTADGAKIEPGRFQQFPVSLGRLPEDTDQLVFKALQTYDNDEVVRWIEEPKEGGEEPDSPAPVLKLAAAAEGHHGAADAGAKAAADSGRTEKSDAGTGTKGVAAAADASDTTARVLGIVGILVGAAGVAFGVLAGRRRSA